MKAINMVDEQEAAVALLFASVLKTDKNLSEAVIEQLSRMLVLSSKFKGHSLNDLSAKALASFTSKGRTALIEEAAPLISDEFKETLFAMICELVTNDGSVNDDESEVLGHIALRLGISIENMRMILTVYLIRNNCAVQVID